MSSPVNHSSRKRVLNTGSGIYQRSKLHPVFHAPNWAEIRLDIDAQVQPDLVGSVTDMRDFAANASFDAIWSSHNIEHLHNHEVGPAFREFHRILRPDGFALITCPDLDAIAQMIVDGRTETVVYVSPAGPITPLDMLYGHSASIAAGNHFMAHNTGFNVERLGRVAFDAGFAEIRINRGRSHDLWALLLMQNTRIETLAPMFQKTEQYALLQ